MGLSPRRGEVQQLTIEVPGPVRRDQWSAYKYELEKVVDKYKRTTTVKPKIVEIVYLSQRGRRVKPDGLKRARTRRRKRQ